MTVLAALVLALYAVLAGVLAPGRLARAAWPQRAPRLALTAWLALAAAFTAAVALTAYHLALTGPGAHAHGLLALLEPGTRAAGPEGPAVLVPIALAAAWPLARIAAAARRARRDRTEHLERLTLAGRTDPGLGAVLLDHPTPVAYCLHRGPVVISSGTVARLTDGQLYAVIQHERAHLAGRHHLLLTLGAGLADAFRGLPLGRGLRAQIAPLLEMLADDRAARSCRPEDLAAAMCEVGTPHPSPATLPAGGGSRTLLRMRRLLRPAPRPRPAVRLVALALIALAPLVPYLLTCGPTPG
ncbi:M56 family metallopeptidase [Kitasatospora brasiliensis]|uniref:M56 family metallopeptidase n=1 Tax=Kitasatospora brasiliensis TaxID=3058040 RepID=UPI00292D2C93|nr:M56 family metallopeptidase [Kitasatospora sp. K002]